MFPLIVNATKRLERKVSTAKGEKIFESKKMTERRDDTRCDVKCGRAALKSRQGKRLGTGAEV
jgi:hypothetical protein